MKTINRNIYFYEVSFSKYVAEKNLYVEFENFKEDCKDMFKAFEKLPFDKNNTDYSKYLKKGNGSYDFIKIDNITDDYIEGKLINCDDTGLTYYEKDGELTFIKEALKENQTIAEISHFVIFIKDKIMAFEYNPKSSHSPSLSNYIKVKPDMKYFVEFKNLLNKNKEKKFDSLMRIKKFRFTTSSRFLNLNKTLNKGPFKAATAALELIDNDNDMEHQITIIVTPKYRITKENKNPYYDANEFKEEIKKANNLKNDTLLLRDGKNTGFELDITGINELNEQIRVNYTKDLITSKIKLEPTKLESENFYEKMKENYIKIKGEYIN